MGWTITNPVGVIRVVKKTHLIHTLVRSFGLKKYSTYDMLENISIIHFHIYDQKNVNNTQFVMY